MMDALTPKEHDLYYNWKNKGGLGPKLSRALGIVRNMMMFSIS